VRTEITVAEEILRDYVGEYQLTPEMSIAITLEDGRLHAEPSGQQKIPLFAEADDMFFALAVNAQVSFTRDSSRAVTALVLHQGGRQQTAPRLR
jgi:hypothetical protein